LIIREKYKIGIEKSWICGARNWWIGTSVRETISRRRADIHCAFIVVITSCNVSAKSVFSQTYILGTRILVVTVCVVSADRLWNTALLTSSRARLAIVPNIRLGVGRHAVGIKFTFVRNTLASVGVANGTELGWRTIGRLFASESASGGVWNRLARSLVRITNWF
jgi:hypothetical protein